MLKFGAKGETNIVFKCTVKLLEDTEILECEYKVSIASILLVCLCNFELFLSPTIRVNIYLNMCASS